MSGRKEQEVSKGKGTVQEPLPLFQDTREIKLRLT
ncbi:hypothetical protein BVRB_4g087540 [Beta vulgaris subsp. vulgaris]|nr:hypothetical protein BVRB_4g087540 [Beta vulgaris subsp. vulgaris]